MITYYAVLNPKSIGRYAGRYGVDLPGNAELVDFEYAARLVAEDYHDYHGGSNDIWPLTFALYDSEDGPELARFSVGREAVPSFFVVIHEPAPAEPMSKDLKPVDETVRRAVERIISAGWEECPTGGNVDGAQMLDVRWWIPKFGCDSLCAMRDVLSEELYKILEERT
jgi:hypothetical protein